MTKPCGNPHCKRKCDLRAWLCKACRWAYDSGRRSGPIKYQRRKPKSINESLDNLLDRAACAAVEKSRNIDVILTQPADSTKDS